MRRLALPCAALALAAALLAACAAHHEHEELLGNWSGEDAEGRRHTFSFDKRGRALWAIEGPDVNEEFEVRYAYDHDPEPHHLDISGIDRGPLQGKTLYCIFEWQGSDAFRLDCEPGEPTADGARVRPADFTGHTLVYMKVTR